MSTHVHPIIADTEFEIPPTEYEGAGQNSAPRTALRTLPSFLRDRYVIEHELSARGSEADIFQVRAVDGSGLRVVKLYRGDKIPKANVLKAVSESQSNYLLKIFEFGESDGHWYELLELIEFGNLRNLLSQGPVSTEQCTELLRQLAQALSDLHDLNIFHRDVKPDNVLIKMTEPLHLVLSDYGIASETDGTSWETGWAGTAVYMAPEIAGGKRQLVSVACDYWALGMVLTEALAGAHPFKNLTIAVAFHHLATKPVDVSLVPLEWRRLCRGLLIRDPQTRWGKDQVQRWLSGERETIPLIEDVASAAVGQTYPFNRNEFDTLLELVSEFAKRDNWSKGSAEVRQGHLTDWLRKTSQYDAASFVEELRGDRTLSDDQRLFLIIARFCPKLPLIWKGQVLDEKNLLALTVRQDETALAILSDVFDQQLLVHPRLEGYDDIQRIGQSWIQAVRENEALWALEPLRALASVHRGDRRIELSNALLAAIDAATRSNLQRNVKELAKNSAARKCDWYARQVSPAKLPHGILHTLARLGNQAIAQGEAAIAEEARQAKAAEDARLWSQRRRNIVAKASFFGLGLGSIMGAIRYWMASSGSLYWMPWDFAKGMERWAIGQAAALTVIYLLLTAIFPLLILYVSTFYSTLRKRYLE
jgi:eukaryotic-like serine/threonine-protein kinase